MTGVVQGRKSSGGDKPLFLGSGVVVGWDSGVLPGTRGVGLFTGIGLPLELNLMRGDGTSVPASSEGQPRGEAPVQART
ncbi:hypothetical protein [Actinomyces qiguomingii]|uniref:hypothetical protein n=1 Tax=Actinomyces qiguomingii TaxID=2057800 RepID=UPI000CA02913|nr:hypothetical protein [Actinomyces qiguomingii]